MAPLEVLLASRFMIFTLVLGRISGMVVIAPIFGTLTLPRQVRALLAVALALLVTPVYLNTTLPPVSDVATYAHLMANEVAIGLLLGLGVTIMFSGIQVAGQIVSQMSGLSLADVFDPGFDESVSMFTQLFHYLTMAVFVAIGGHRIMIEAVLETFAWAPPGHAALGETYVDTLTGLMSQSFALGIHAAAPLMIALFLSTIVLGLIGRTLPQINIIAVGFGINSFLTLAMTLLSLGTVAWTFQEPTIDALRALQDTLHP
ncbi:MAG: flagellar biosynthetic protein FliR [Pirellulales bacterium]